MNICLVSKELYPFQKAGIGVYMHNLSKLLDHHGHQVYIITDSKNTKEIKKESSIEYIGVNAYEYGDILEAYPLAYSMVVKNKLEELFKRVKIDVVEFCDYFGEAFFSILYKQVEGFGKQTPFLLKLHTSTYECNKANDIKDLQTELIQQEDFTITHSDFVYAISHYVEGVTRKRLGRQDINVLYNPIELKAKEGKAPTTNIEEKRYVLYVGRLQNLKGIDQLIDAGIKLFQKGTVDISFIIIGQDTIDESNNISVKEQHQQRIPDALKEKFIWIDSMKQEELKNYYENAYVSVFPSRYEGFGNVCVEAMACGSPVIVSSNTGLEEVVNFGEYGLVYKNGCAIDLYNKLVSILKDKQMQEKLSIVAKKRAQDFQPDILYMEQISYYEQIKKTYVYQSYTKNINGAIIVESTKKIKQYKEENKRLLYEYDVIKSNINQLQKECLMYQKENIRILEEWEKTNNANQLLKSQEKRLLYEYDVIKNNINQLQKECLMYQKENIRILEEWEKTNNANQLLKSQNINYKKENEYKDIEIQRLEEIVEQRTKESKAYYDECLSYRDENKRLAKEWDIQAKINRALQEEKGILVSEIHSVKDESQEKIQNLTEKLKYLQERVSDRKYLIRELLKFKK